MYRTVITKTYRFHDFLPAWAPEPFRSQNSDPRGVPEMGPALQWEQHFEEPKRIGVSKTHMKIKLPGILCVKNQYAEGGRLFSARTQGRETWQKWGQRCSGSNILKNRKESECQKRCRKLASAAAGATF